MKSKNVFTVRLAVVFLCLQFSKKNKKPEKSALLISLREPKRDGSSVIREFEPIPGRWVRET